MTVAYHPKVPDGAPDPDGRAVHEAEDASHLRWVDEGFEDEVVLSDELADYVQGAMRRAGFSVTDLPEIVLDIADDCEAVACYSWAANVLHFHPQLLGKGSVLHELAHVGRPQDHHGRQFRALLVGLVRTELGRRFGDILLEEYALRGLDIDPGWLLDPDAFRGRLAEP